MTDYVELNNLSKTSNYLLNILWDRNHKMTLDELTDAVNSDFSLHLQRNDVKKFLTQLVADDYVETKRHGFKRGYVALGTDPEWE